MSLILNNDVMSSMPIYEDGEDERAMYLERYLAVMETNRQSCAFVPTDALLAMDMVAFVSSRIRGNVENGRISTARLALSLVQPAERGPMQ